MSDEVFTGGATTSQHVDAEDDDHFENTTFKLKRTRSLGLLDEFIPEKVKEQSLAAGTTPRNRNNGVDTTTPPSNDQPDSNNTNSNQSTSVSSSPSPVPSPTSGPALNLQSPELIPYDDTNVAAEPSRHVDYLSHQWDVSDISKSWRYVVSNKHDVANAARLENASWRTWAQRRSNLKTISPEVVNWAKDTDVTWLYGPILKNKGVSSGDGNDENEDDVNHEPTATSAVAGDISIPKKSKNKNAPKPILKKRTIEESIISHTNLLKLELASSIHQKKREQQLKQQQELQKQNQATDEYFDYNALSNKLNSQYSRNQTTDNSSVARFQNLLNSSNKSNSNSSSSIKQDSQTGDHASSKNDQLATEGGDDDDDEHGERHIHFNDVVQQCVAYDSFSDGNDEEGGFSDYEDTDEIYDDYDDQVNDNLIRSHLYEGDLENEDSGSDEDDEGGFFLKVKSNSNPTLKLAPSQGSSPSIKSHDQTDLDSFPSLKRCTSIKHLPPTTLNYGSDEDSSDEDYPYTSSLSHNVGNDISRGYDYYYDYNSVYPSDPYQYQGSQTPDVVDVPENLDMGSNVNYDLIDNNNNNNNNKDVAVGTLELNEHGDREGSGKDGALTAATSTSTSGGTAAAPASPVSGSSPASPLSGPKTPIAHLGTPTHSYSNHNSQLHSQSVHMPFQFSDSEDDEEEGLSIGTRRSSQALAESIFHGHNPLTENRS
ncbi:REG1 [Candida theae]|uniref:REG1 n=1 Tax=Candida theae TaxID=1198502 RepID=A0AAD5BDQ8_9ASCO|nr:REG1 [Candida theae]KAI5957438.1 REG1 [Candida theae]